MTPEAKPNAYSIRGRASYVDPLRLNTTPAIGAAVNPFGEAVISKSPAPITDPLGYGLGFYKPGSKLGKLQNKVNDPLKVFQSGQLGGLLGF
jgi:hypothetical protein